MRERVDGCGEYFEAGARQRTSYRLIGATTMDEYRKNIEKDKALSRRFQGGDGGGTER